MTTINKSQLLNEYPNPLDEFRSYSYQFLLTLSSTTQAFREMIGNNTDASGNIINGSAPLLSAVNNAKRPGDPFTVNGQTAYLLVDTRRFSQYSITELIMDHVYGSGSTTNPTVPVSATHMQLIDTTGMSFFNMLMETFRNKLQTTRASAFFLLTIIFTGHKDDGTTETISTCFIPLILLTTKFTLDHRGTTFEIDFMEVEGAPGKGGPMEIVDYMGNVKSISTKGLKHTLGGMLTSLEKKLNVQSLDFFQSYTNTAAKTAAPNAKLGKLVQYMITIPDEWAEFPIKLAPRSKNKEQTFTASTAETPDTTTVASVPSTVVLKDEGEYMQLSFSQTTSITDAIKVVLETAPDFLALASEENMKAGTAQTFRTIMNITCDDNTYVVHFDIYPHYLPKVDVKDKNAPGANTTTINPGSKSNVGASTEIRNLMTFNYIFTGKNSHIKDLKIEYLPESAIALDTNLNLGQSRLAVVSEQGQSAKNMQLAGDDTAKKKSSYAPELRGGDPIFFAPKSKDEQNNIATQKTEGLPKDEAIDAIRKKQEYTNTMAYVHFLSSIELEMTIRGNPNIIKKYADRNERGGMAPHVSIIDSGAIMSLQGASGRAEDTFNRILADKVSSAKRAYYTSFVEPRLKRYKKAGPPGTDSVLAGPDVATSPVFCKINILAPNVDSLGDTPRNPDGSLQPFYTDEFFFNGAYMVLFVNTTFSAGEFEHKLSLIPYIVSESTTQKDEPAAAPTKKVK